VKEVQGEQLLLQSSASEVFRLRFKEEDDEEPFSSSEGLP